ncbi:MAG: energy transducer TonB [Burkholderiales bacterium]|nr:energy transducer TonB [Burkholderiales bacterium]
MRPNRAAKVRAWIGTLLVHAVLAAVLFFSVQWKQVRPERASISVDLVAQPKPAPPPAPAPPAPPAPPPPPPAPPPAPVARPMPAPPAPRPAPPRPPPAPQPSAADIARKKAEEAKKLAEKQAQEKAAQEKAAAEKAALERAAQARAEAERLAAERAAAERAAAERAAAERAAQERAAAERAAAERAAAERAAAERAAQEAAARARARAEADYVNRIRTKVRSNIILAAEIPGNPEAIFEVNQLPTGEVVSVQLIRSSGHRAYDEAVERAILKSSPLPRPSDPELFQRRLVLRFRPYE